MKLNKWNNREKIFELEKGQRGESLIPSSFRQQREVEIPVEIHH